LNYNNKPIVILNTDGFYDKLIEFFNDIILKGFAHNDTERIYYVAQTPEEALEYINNYVPEKLTDKYIIR
jgi:predicted Rossmann-fold nucleotide-binding protein